jgi:hypothetical protein
MMRHLFACLFAVLLGLAAGTAAVAQSPMPVGVWHSGGGASLYISERGTCAYTGVQAKWLGHCYWYPEPTGGLLTLDAGDEGGIEFNVRWLDANRFSIFGDDFYRRP